MTTVDDLQALLDPQKRLPDEVTARIAPDMLGRVEKITCADGFTVSMQASAYHYCGPRDSEGPWTEVELGFPSEREEAFMEWAEQPDQPTETVYGWVPIKVVAEVVDRRGGLAARA